ETPTTSNAGLEGNTKASLAMSNMSNSPDVLLKTLIVNLSCGEEYRKVRLVIDDGSQRSYVLKTVAEELSLKAIGREPMIHALFGGMKSDPVDHIRYEVSLGKLDGSYNCTLKVLDQPTICSPISKVPRGPWLGELKKRRIWISDVGADVCRIDMLIGADFAGKLLTGQVRHLKSGLVAVETKLGWTLMGETLLPERSWNQPQESISVTH
ncbi:unnamed protein product, partial [Allacma fusca]